MLPIVATISATVTLAMIGVMAGLFFAFSNSVMRALDAVSPECAIRAMQSINRKILNPVFLATFVLAPVVAMVTGWLLIWLDETWAAAIMIAAAVVYALGSLAVTFVVNVPMNNALDAATVPTDPNEAAGMWSDYSGPWTRWNTLRALACTVSLLLVGLSLFAWGREW